MGRYLLFFSLLVSSAFFTATTYAAQQIQVGVETSNYYPLYGIFDENDKDIGKYNGLAYEIFELYNKSQSEFELVYQPRPIKRLFQEFLADDSKLDAKFPDNQYWASDLKKGKNVLYTAPIIDNIDGVFILKENKSMALKDIKKMGALAGFSPFDYDAQIKSGQITVEDSNSTTALLEKLVQKRIDVVYISKLIGVCKAMKMKGGENVVFADTLPNSNSSFSLSTLKYPKLIASFNEFQKSHKAQIEKLTKDYTVNKCK